MAPLRANNVGPGATSHAEIDAAMCAKPTDLPATTAWYRARGRPSRREKAAKEQYLAPHEERALASYVVRMSNNGFPLPVKCLQSLALVIRRQRVHADDSLIKPPGKNWSQGFYKRNPDVLSRRTKAMDWRRHDMTIYDRLVDWFDVIGKELRNDTILEENVYNMDETGLLLSALGSLKVLVDSKDSRNYRGAGSQRTLITAIECISANGTSLPPLIIWPAATHRSTWTTYETPGWRFACSETGYTNNEISLYWVQHVFDPLTKARANGKPRLLISDGFATHESLEVMTFCFENDIILCRLPSHTSHKLQPCDVAVFGPLKTAYREQVEQLFRGGAGTIGKQHFTLLYSRAREIAFTPCNIRSGWSKAGLFPFNPERVLMGMTKPPAPTSSAESDSVLAQANVSTHARPLVLSLKTPTISRSFNTIREQVIGIVDGLEDSARLHVQKVLNGAEQAFAYYALLQEENCHLLQQNSEKKARNVKATVISQGEGKILTYEDIIQAKVY